MPKRDSTYMANRREEILEATGRCIQRVGISATTTTEICREAGISMGALYKHFKSKEEIFNSLADQAARQVKIDLSFHTVAEAYEYLRTRILHLYDSRYADLFKVEVQLVAETLSSRTMPKVGEGNYALAWGTLADAFRGLEESGQVKLAMSPEQAATLLESLTYGLYFRATASGAEPKEHVLSTLNRLLDFIFNRA